MVDMSTIGMKFGKKFTDTLKAAWLTQAAQRLTTLSDNRESADGAFTVIRAQVDTRIMNQLKKLSASSLRTTQESIDVALKRTREELRQAMVYGENTIPALTKAVQNVFTDAEKFRAQRIAVTESSMAIHDADILAAVTSNVVRGFVPVISKDACSICQVYNEEGEPTGKANFPYTNISDAEKLIGNYENRTLPPFHPNCRCSQRAVLITDTTAYEKPVHAPKPKPIVVEKPKPKPKPIVVEKKPKPKPKPVIEKKPKPIVVEKPKPQPVVEQKLDFANKEVANKYIKDSLGLYKLKIDEAGPKTEVLAKEVEHLATNHKRFVNSVRLNGSLVDLNVSDRSAVVGTTVGTYEPRSSQMKLAGNRSFDVGKGFKPGMWALNKNLQDTFRHEFGHAHQASLSEADVQKWYKIYVSKSKDEWKSSVTKYGGLRGDELYAESFAIYTHPNYKRGALPKEIEQFFDEV
jgi:hypothetical protein